VSKEKRAKILCVDFDGVIHSYLSGWKGATEIPDPPVKGAIEWLNELCDHPEWDPQIYSSRSKEEGAIDAMRAWLKRHGLKYWDVIGMPTQKPAAFLTVDDRAICFRGTFPSRLEMTCFRPWTAGFVNEIYHKLEECDEAATETAQREFCTGLPKKPYEKPKLTQYGELTWDDCAIEFEQSFNPEGYRVKVEDKDGIVIQTFVHLYEWSGYVTPYINDKDIPGLVRYLVELNRLEVRDGSVIREA